MRKVAFFLVVAFLSAFSSSAFAQATRTWVSGVGDDANPCSRTAPCKTFAGAISKTAAGGEINVLDPGGFGGVTITKSITIDGSGGSIAGVLVSGTNGMTINDSGAGTAVVTIRNIDFEGLGFSTASPGIKGISFVSGAVLHVQRCTIRDFRDAANGTGIAFTPSTSAKLFVEDTVLSGNGNNTVGGGIIIQPSGAATVKASLVRVNMENNVLGIRADGTGSTGGINVSITDSQSNGNAFAGITAFTPAASGASTKVMVNNTTVANNGTGLNANGANAILRVGNSVVFGNTTGVNIANSAVMTSYNNNQIDDNPTPGPTIPLTNPLK